MPEPTTQPSPLAANAYNLSRLTHRPPQSYAPSRSSNSNPIEPFIPLNTGAKPKRDRKTLHPRPTLSPLLAAAERGDLNSIETLLKAGADLQKTADPRKLPSSPSADALILAARNGHTEAVKALLNAGADVNLAAGYGSALDEATTNGHTPAVILLLRAGARTVGQGLSLFSALENNHLDTIRAFANAKMPIAKYRSRYKESLLERAIRRRKGEAVSLLLDLGVKPIGDGSLVAAAFAGDAELTHRLIKLGANPNEAGGALRRLPLCSACSSGDKPTIEVLLENGADPTAADVRGWTCLDWARHHRRRHIIAWLRTYATKAGIKIPERRKT